MSEEKSFLFDEKTRRKLEQLMLQASRVRAGAIKGERRSTKRGTSIEFADYRNYAPGDDLRRLDWNIYARLDRPLTKLFEDEEDLAVHMILDTSASMNWPRDGDGDLNKFTYARRLLAGMAYISLFSNDRLLVTAMSDGDMHHFGPARGRPFSVRLLQFVSGLKANGTTDLNASLKDYVLRAGRPGLCVIVTDMFSRDGYIEGINALLGKGHEVAILHVLSPDEVNPELAGDLRLVDVETGAPQEVSVDGMMREMYVKRLAEWRDGMQMELRKRGAHYIPVQTDTPWEKVILYDLRRIGLVR
jgi:uncharacterized protein (DUF58 family)